MACEEFQDQIVLLRRGELEPEAAGAVRSHLEACAPCRAAYDAEEALAALLAGATRHAAPPGLRERVAAALRAEGARRPAGRWAAWLGPPLPHAAAAAALALLVAVPLTWWLARRPPAPIVVLAREVAQEHERVERTRDWEGGLQGPDAALAQLAGWPEVEFPRPPVAAGGLRLVGGRPTYLFERKAAAFVYRDEAGNTVTLFVFRGADIQLPERGRVQVEQFKPYFAAAEGSTLCVWKQKEAGFSLVGKMSQGELARAFLTVRRTL